jgi:hypothetical protein
MPRSLENEAKLKNGQDPLVDIQLENLSLEDSE